MSSDDVMAMDETFTSLLTAINALRRTMEPYFANFGIGGSQWAVLRALTIARSEGHAALRLTDLSSRLLVTPPNITQVVDRLERMRLVERTEAQSDHRVKLVRLTRAGHKLAQRVREGHADRVENLLGGLNQKERGELRRLLGQLTAHATNNSGIQTASQPRKRKMATTHM